MHSSLLMCSYRLNASFLTRERNIVYPWVQNWYRHRRLWIMIKNIMNINQIAALAIVLRWPYSDLDVHYSRPCGDLDVHYSQPCGGLDLGSCCILYWDDLAVTLTFITVDLAVAALTLGPVAYTEHKPHDGHNQGCIFISRRTSNDSVRYYQGIVLNLSSDLALERKKW